MESGGPEPCFPSSHALGGRPGGSLAVDPHPAAPHPCVATRSTLQSRVCLPGLDWALPTSSSQSPLRSLAQSLAAVRITPCLGRPGSEFCHSPSLLHHFRRNLADSSSYRRQGGAEQKAGGGVPAARGGSARAWEVEARSFSWCLEPGVDIRHKCWDPGRGPFWVCRGLA